MSMSFRKNHIKPKIKDIKRKKLTHQPFFWLGLLLLLVIISIFYLLLFSKFFQISHIKVSGYKSVDNASVENIVWNHSYKNFFSAGIVNIDTQSIFILSKESLSRKIKSTFPIIKNIKIKKSLPNLVDLVIEERTPFAVFCQNENNSCFAIDEEGVIFEKIESIPENTMTLRISSQKDISLGEQAILQKTINSVSKIRENLKNNFKIDVRDVTISQTIDVKTFEGWTVYFDAESDIDSQITKMNALLSGEITESERKNIEYVYLQYKDRAYYK